MALLEAVTASQPLAPAVAREILAMAGGNPLALVELPAALSGGERAGGVAAAAAPAARRGRSSRPTAAAWRASTPAPGGRWAWPRSATARPPGRSSGPSSAWAATPGTSWPPRRPGFLTLDGDVARLRHPLLRPIALELMEPAERRDAHRALAEALDRDRDVEQRAWHLAEAAVGPDDVVAAALEAAATRAAARTGYATAATFLARAATVAPDPLRSGRDLLGAAQLAMAAGDAARGSALLERLWESGPDPSVRAETAHLPRSGHAHDHEHRRRLRPPPARGPDGARRGSGRRRRDARHGGPRRGPWRATAARRCAACRRRTGS